MWSAPGGRAGGYGRSESQDSGFFIRWRHHIDNPIDHRLTGKTAEPFMEVTMLMPDIQLAAAGIAGLAVGGAAGVAWARRAALGQHRKLKRAWVQESQAKTALAQERNELRAKLRDIQDHAQKKIAAAQAAQAQRIHSLESQLAQMHQLTRDLLQDEHPAPGEAAAGGFAPTQPYDPGAS
jgi:hypothetical protein